jgi:hypothetical protein
MQACGSATRPWSRLSSIVSAHDGRKLEALINMLIQYLFLFQVLSRFGRQLCPFAQRPKGGEVAGEGTGPEEGAGEEAAGEKAATAAAEWHHSRESEEAGGSGQRQEIEEWMV